MVDLQLLIGSGTLDFSYWVSNGVGGDWSNDAVADVGLLGLNLDSFDEASLLNGM